MKGIHTIMYSGTLWAARSGVRGTRRLDFSKWKAFSSMNGKSGRRNRIGWENLTGLLLPQNQVTPFVVRYVSNVKRFHQCRISCKCADDCVERVTSPFLLQGKLNGIGIRVAALPVIYPLTQAIHHRLMEVMCVPLRADNPTRESQLGRQQGRFHVP